VWKIQGLFFSLLESLECLLVYGGAALGRVRDDFLEALSYIPSELR